MTRGSSSAKSSVGQSVSVLPQWVPTVSQLGGKEEWPLLQVRGINRLAIRVRFTAGILCVSGFAQACAASAVQISRAVPECLAW